MSQSGAAKSAPYVTSLPPPPSTGSIRGQSPTSHAAASTLAGLAQNSPPSGSKAPANPRPTASSAKQFQGLYSSTASSSDSPLKKVVEDTLASGPGSTKGQEDSSSSASPVLASAKPGKQRESAASKRKKANRACSHCQKAHLTCDDARPCTRCVKKGLGNTCTDGVRKKAKYLLDDEELEELKRNKEAKKAAKLANQQAKSKQQSRPTQSASSGNEANSERQPDSYSGINAVSAPAVTSLVDQAAGETTPASSGHGPSPHQSGDFTSSNNFDVSTSTDALGSGSALPFQLNFDPTMHNFGSEATSLEYSILSSMLNDHILGGPGSGSPDMQNSPAIGVMDGWNITDAHNHNGESGFDDLLNVASGQRTEAALPGLIGMDPIGSSYNSASGTYGAMIGTGGASLQEIPAGNGFNALEVPSPKPSQVLGDPSLHQDASDAQGSSSTAAFDLGSSSQRSTSNEPVTDINQAIASRRYARRQQDANWRARIAKTYRDNTAPFPYPKGYHFLIKYVTEKFQKEEALRIVRALAIFRPSLIALQMPLTEEDEIFVERALQRTILEFEKLISFSGTPTVVWRRTCEICVVGAEFCMLTHWSRDQLMGRRIYEFMDTDSTLDYWEKFALHAFENTSQSVMTTCTLVKPDGKLVPCAWSFTIKRDTFDLPSLIVGNFLPILS